MTPDLPSSPDGALQIQANRKLRRTLTSLLRAHRRREARRAARERRAALRASSGEERAIADLPAGATCLETCPEDL